MNRKEIMELADASLAKAQKVLAESGISEVWERAGCRVNVVGSLRMGLMATHRDIDLHVYSKNVTAKESFLIMSEIAENPRVTEIKCINGLHTDEHCVAWHVMYRAEDEELWQFDIIHIEEGSRYDGYFERMADRINEIMTEEQRHLILKLKFEAPAESGYHGVEFYEAVIADGVKNLEEFEEWVCRHRSQLPYYWIP